MRRGHPGTVGWRSGNQRHFRPRSGGSPHFRPPRGYGLMETPRFPPPGPRLQMGGPYNSYPRPLDSRITPDHYERNFRPCGRPNAPQRPRERNPHYHNQKQIFPLLQRTRHGDVPDHAYKDTPNYYEDKNQQNVCLINSMGDVDHRQLGNVTKTQDTYIQRPSPWINPPFFEDRSHNKPFRHESNEQNKIPVLDYTGHRPPSSDHYDSTNLGLANDDSNAFSRSVDDTVDIVRKRLMNRDLQHPLENAAADEIDGIKEPTDNIRSSFSNIEQQPIKKKAPREGLNVKSNCNKMKNKIVHQLFMMDKDKIHKLMDNPRSSTKFEYAISSLITESQNSYNRHLRSVAEKSLCSSSTDFIHNDNNTIYEDTFMKQMQSLLDPQDTVLLEDIKPMVLAELSKVLQLEDFEMRQEADEHFPYPSREEQFNYDQYEKKDADHPASSSKDDQLIYDQYSNETYSYENYSSFESFSPENPPQSSVDRSENSVFGSERHRENSKNLRFDPEPLFERRQSRRSSDYSHSRQTSSENRFHRTERKSVDQKSSEGKIREMRTSIPLFDSNVEHLSEEEDPFAELDRQYHVAVDPSFIAADDLLSPQTPPPVTSNAYHSPNKEGVASKAHSPEKTSYYIKLPKGKVDNTPSPLNKMKTEIDSQLLNMAKSPLKFSSNLVTEKYSKVKCDIDEALIQLPHDIKPAKVKQEVSSSSDVALSRVTSPTKQIDHVLDSKNQEHATDPQVMEEDKAKVECSSTMIKSSTSSTRKRSIDQRPSHRKEKRKKSESESNKQILNKNIIINVNDCAAKSLEKCDAPKSIFNLFFSKEQNEKEVSQETDKVESTDKEYSDKYVKRKETPTKKKESESKKSHDSSSSSHSNQCATDNNISGHTPIKTDGKTKLKPINMFTDLPRKSNIHHAHRNTSVITTTTKTPVDIKVPAKQTSRKITRRHIATQVMRKLLSKETQTFESKSYTSRFCQTEKKLALKSVQTDPVSFKATSKSTDAFERMKEIDMEIQSLLQEKFKLYSSLEARQSCPNTIQSLGMAVLNVTPFEETNVTPFEETKDNTNDSNLSADAIVDDFTSIPVHELEQIALESVQEEENTHVKKDTKRQKVKENKRKSYPTLATSASRKRYKNKEKTPNISLIEQIITDDRPLEDIISLDDFENVPLKSKKKSFISHDDENVAAKSKKKPIISLDDFENFALKSKKKSQLKKKGSKKAKSTKRVLNFTKDKQKTDYGLKECSVVIMRQDLSKYLNRRVEMPSVIEILDEPELDIHQVSNIVEEVVNDLHFDMLDVSEDIVIGDNCEVKSMGDKDVNYNATSVCEEIILDNSQDEVLTGEARTNSNECKMYDYSADENLRRDTITVTGNADAVLAIEYIENNFIAACLDGNVYYFSGDGQLLNTLRGSNLAVTCLTIVKEKYGTTVYTGSLDSRIRYYDLETGLEKGPECNVLSPIQTMDRAWDTVFVGTRTGFVLQFECKNNMLIPISTVKFSEQSILALRAIKEGPRKVLLVAARSEAVTIKDAQTGLLLRSLEGPKMTVYTLLFEDGKVYCGTSSHQIHVFDYASGSHVGSHEGGKGAVCLRAAGGLLFAGCYDGCVYVYREGEGAPIAQLRGPGLMLLSLAVLGTKIIAGYKDRGLYIWKMPLSILQEMIL